MKIGVGHKGWNPCSKRVLGYKTAHQHASEGTATSAGADARVVLMNRWQATNACM